MCWVGYKYNKRIADKNITVYKVIERKKSQNKTLYTGPFQCSFEYEIGKTYSTDIEEKYINGSMIRIEQGFHCFYEKAWVDCYSPCFYSIGYVYDLDPLCFELAATYVQVIVKCIIPKGAIYYVNKHGIVVAEKLILKEDLGFPRGFKGFAKDYEKYSHKYGNIEINGLWPNSKI